MFLITDYIDPAELTGYTRAALADFEQNQFTLARFLPSRNIDDLDYRFTAGGEGLVDAATFRVYDAPSPFGTRKGVQRVSGELPPISRQLRLNEYDRLRLRAAGDDAILNAIYADARRLARQIAARMEMARGEALYKGKIVLSENGVVATVDFGRAAGHTVTAGTAWTDTATSTPITNLVSWVDTYVAANGEKPGVALVSTRIARLMQRNAEVINAVAGAAAERTRVTAEELNALLQSEGLPPIEVYDAQVNVGGSATRIIPDDRVVLAPAPGDPNDPESTDLGATLWGTTAEALEDEYAIESPDQPGIVAGTYKSPDPVAVFTKASAIGLPVMANPNLTFAADVA
ncbi:major capsid protein [Nocardioides aquiterrae]|uniref:Major capsid protein E n=1 Tax=Nocardioides aquiterrae TaxID=203799 RepID=A0ABP4EWZ1_9ACTN